MFEQLFCGVTSDPSKGGLHERSVNCKTGSVWFGSAHTHLPTWLRLSIRYFLADLMEWRKKITDGQSEEGRQVSVSWSERNRPGLWTLNLEKHKWTFGRKIWFNRL